MIDFSEKVKVLRISKGVLKSGFYEKGETSEFSIVASVQPHFFREIDRLPEGREISDAIKIYSVEKLVPKSKELGADRVLYNGEYYEVYNVKNYSSFDDCPHYKTLALRFNDEQQIKVSNEH